MDEKEVIQKEVRPDKKESIFEEVVIEVGGDKFTKESQRQIQKWAETLRLLKNL